MKIRLGIAALVVLSVSALVVAPFLRSKHRVHRTYSDTDVLRLQMNTDVHAVAVGNNDLAFRLLHQLTAKSPGQNVFISPYSIGGALAMALNGAAGQTYADMSHMLGLAGTNINAINDGNRQTLAWLENADPKVDVSIGNALWVQNKSPIRKDFADRCSRYYDGQATDLDLNGDPSGSAEKINACVSDATEGKIPEIVDDEDVQESALILTDAVYFKGEWQNPFDRAETSNDTFYPESGTSQSLPFMHRDTNYAYVNTDHYQAVAVPYGNGRMDMIMVLPQDSRRALEDDAPEMPPHRQLREILDTLNEQGWNKLTASLTPTDVDLHFPRFNLKDDTKLNAPLKALGMGCAFDPNRADFSRMSPVALHIDQVLHKTMLQVDETGTAAAAATTGDIGTVAADIVESSMFVNHPFLCAIRDTVTGTILFVGAVYDPLGS